MNKGKTVLILGIGGQDGYFLSHLATDNGWSVTGFLLRSDMTAPTIPFLPHSNLRLVESSICDHERLKRIMVEDRPQLIFNFAGISFIPYSWDAPREVEKTNGYAVGEILQIIREVSPETRFFQACSSEMFGHNPKQSPQNEDTQFNPDNPYGSSKVFAYHLTRNYREKFGIFACSGILYNHESEWRPPKFVTRKIALAAASIKLGRQDVLELGDLNTVRDWSYAGDIVNAMWLMMNADKPKDYVLASGSLHTVGDILDIAFDHVGLNYLDFVKVDEALRRSPEGLPLCGDSNQARRELSWKPEMNFESMIRMMVDTDLERLKKLK
jgi:GDPmannose 4,6-dehydratase